MIASVSPEKGTVLFYSREMHQQDVDAIEEHLYPDQTAPDVGLHCLPRLISPNT